MNILGIETSCDETAAAVVRDGTSLLSNIVASQIDIHAQYGGVVPEVAARSHIEVILPVIEKSLGEAKISWNEVDAIAVTEGPGLVGSLLIGDLTASTLSRLMAKPLIPVNHVEAHVYANFLLEEKPAFPLLALIVSGGHTQLVLFRGHGDYDVLGRTRDDAAGEAYDKVAKMLGLPYPGGPAIEKTAKLGDSHAYGFPKPKLGDSLDFSFSGLKTAVLRAAQTTAGRDFKTPSFELAALLSDQQRYDLAASFHRTAVETLSGRVLKAYRLHSPASIAIVGGVASSPALREELSRKLPIEINYAPMKLCTDNAAMIASLGFYYYQADRTATMVTPNPVLSM